MKRLLAILLSVVISVSGIIGVSAASVNETEPNNSFETATQISLGDSVSGVTEASVDDDEDFYKLTAPSNGKITLTFCHTYDKKNDIGRWDVYLYKYTKGKYTSLSLITVCICDNEEIELPYIGAEENCVYYVRVVPDGSASYIVGEKYTIKTDFISSDYFEKESNDSHSDPDPITLGKTYNANIGKDIDIDIFKITAPANGKITLSFGHTPGTGGTYTAWYIIVWQYIDGKRISLSDKVVHITDAETIELPYIGAVENGVYHISVVAQDQNEGVVGENYTLTTTFTKSEYYEKEQNNSFSSATLIVPGKSYGGNIYTDADVDYYKITTPANGKLNISINYKATQKDEQKYLLVTLYQYTQGKYKALSDARIYYYSPGKVELPFTGAVKNGVYYLKIAYEGYYFGDDYTIKTTLTESNYYEKEQNGKTSDATSIKVGKSYTGVLSKADDIDYYKYVASSNSAVVLNLKANSKNYDNDSKKFSVTIYKNVNGELKKLASEYIHPYESKSIDFPSVGVVKNGVYYIKVAAYKGYSYIVGENYTIKLSEKLSTPVIKTVRNSTSGVSLKWSEIGGASGYYVYRKASGSSEYSKIATIKNGSTVSYTDKTAKAGTTYSYKIKSYTGDVVSSDSKVVSIKRLATPKVTVSNALSGVTVKWNKITGAKGYYVYRKIGSGEYKKIATIKSGSTVSYTDKKASAGKTYTYYVKAYNGDYVSSYKASTAIERLKAPTIKSVTSGKSGVTVKWAKSTGADGYYVYRKTGSGSYSKIATVKGNTKVTYLDKSAKKGKTYTYKIKAYSGKSVSVYSKTLKIKDKY